MLFEALVNRSQGRLPSLNQNRASGVGRITILSSNSEATRGAIGGSVLVASKVLRALALLAAYKALSSGLSSVTFVLATLALASVSLGVLQRPWMGKKLNPSNLFQLFLQSILLSSTFVCWSTGLLLCGPATTVLLEYMEVILLRLGRKLFSKAMGAEGRWTVHIRSLVLFTAACSVMVWERSQVSRVAADLQKADFAKGVAQGLVQSLEGSELLEADPTLNLTKTIEAERIKRLALSHGVKGSAPSMSGLGAKEEETKGTVGSAAEGLKAKGLRNSRVKGKHDKKSEAGLSPVVLHDLVISGLDASVQLDNGSEEQQNEEDSERKPHQAWDSLDDLEEESVESGNGGTEEALPFEFAARTMEEFLLGIGMHLLAAALSALRKSHVSSTCKVVGGPKRFMALACPVAVLQLLLVTSYTHLVSRAKVGVQDDAATVSGNWRQLTQFAVMGILVPFYAGNFADKNLPGERAARIGLISGVASFLFTWAVRMSPVEFSSGVVAITVVFLILSIGDDVGDDSVPLGVYSVPGFARADFGGAWGYVKTFLRQMLSHSYARRIGLFIVTTFLFMAVELLYGLRTRRAALVTHAVNMSLDLVSLFCGLFGAITSSWRPTPIHLYGFARYEVLCAFSNGVFTLVTALLMIQRSIQRLWSPEVPKERTEWYFASAGILLDIFGMVCLSRFRHSKGGGKDKQRSDPQQEVQESTPSGKLSRKRGTKTAKDDTKDTKRAVRLLDVKSTQEKPSLGKTVQKFIRQAKFVVQLPIILTRRRRSLNMQAMFLHILCNMLRRIALLVAACVVHSPGWEFSDPLCSLLVGILVCASVMPLLFDAGGVLLQVTPPAISPAMQELQNQIEKVRGVAKCNSLHVWRLSADGLVGTAAVKTEGDGHEDDILREVSSILRSFGVSNTCVQVEPPLTQSPAVRRAAMVEKQIRDDEERYGASTAGSWVGAEDEFNAVPLDSNAGSVLNSLESQRGTDSAHSLPDDTLYPSAPQPLSPSAPGTQLPALQPFSPSSAPSAPLSAAQPLMPPALNGHRTHNGHSSMPAELVLEVIK